MRTIILSPPVSSLHIAQYTSIPACCAILECLVCAGHGKRTADLAVARADRMPGKRQQHHLRQKAREPAAAEDYDNLGPHPDATIFVMIILAMLILTMLIMTMLASGWALVLVGLGVVPMLNRCRQLTPGQCRIVRIANLHDITGHNMDVDVKVGSKV